MGTGRKFHKKPATRPIKRGAARKRRVQTQRKRLVDLGLKETAIRKMTTKQIRESLRCPDKTRALAAQQDS